MISQILKWKMRMACDDFLSTTNIFSHWESSCITQRIQIYPHDRFVDFFSVTWANFLVTQVNRWGVNCLVVSKHVQFNLNFEVCICVSKLRFIMGHDPWFMIIAYALCTLGIWCKKLEPKPHLNIKHLKILHHNHVLILRLFTTLTLGLFRAIYQ